MTQKVKYKGFSIIELMVALLIGLLLLGGIIQIFILSRTNYKVQQSLNYMQENLRFAAAEIGYAARMAGYFHVVGTPNVTPSRGGSPLSSALNTGQNAYEPKEIVMMPGTPNPPCGIANWGVGLQGFNGAGSDPTGCIGANYVANTDVIATTYLQPVFMELRNVAPIPNSPGLDPNQLYALIFDLTRRPVGLSQGGVIGTGTAIPAAAIQSALYYNPNDKTDERYIRKNGTAPANLLKRSAAMMPLVLELYYIRACSVTDAVGACTAASDGGDPLPTLVRRRLLANGTLQDEPVVDGIEQMQVEYLASGCGGYVSATDVSAWTACTGTVPATYRRWQRVMNARIRLLARSATRESSLNDLGPYDLSADTPAYVPSSVAARFPSNQKFRRSLQILNVQPRNAIIPRPPLNDTL